MDGDGSVRRWLWKHLPPSVSTAPVSSATKKMGKKVVEGSSDDQIPLCCGRGEAAIFL